MKLKQMIVDADICIKIGLSEKYLFVEKLFPCIAEKIVTAQAFPLWGCLC